jgi:ParB-like chromosome segregation protein Spo0J
MRSGQAIPPISVYRVDGMHYVQDGHHRVSVARAVGMRTVDAFVTEVMTSGARPSPSACAA